MIEIYFLIIFILSILNTGFMVNYAKIFKIKEWIKGFFNVKKVLPTHTDFRSISEYYIISFWTTIKVLTIFFLLIGVLSYMWKVFLSVILLWSGLSFLSKVLDKYKLLCLTLDLLSQFILATSLLFLSLNYFHFGLTF